MSPERKSSSTWFQGPSLSSFSMMPGQTLTRCWMPENWSTLGGPPSQEPIPHTPAAFPKLGGSGLTCSGT